MRRRVRERQGDLGKARAVSPDRLRLEGERRRSFFLPSSLPNLSKILQNHDILIDSKEFRAITTESHLLFFTTEFAFKKYF